MDHQTELLLGPIIGGLSHNQVYFWGRSKGTGVIYAWIGKDKHLDDAILGGKSEILRSEDGFSGVAPVFDLEPDTQYFYSLTLGGTPPQPGQTFPGFRTFPSPHSLDSFLFAFGSCFRPSNMEISAIFSSLAAYGGSQGPRFCLMIGDQIYADDFETNGIGKVATTLEDYRSVYQHVWSHPHFRATLANLPVFLMMDDHEVDDDWRWTDFERTWAYIPWWDMVVRFFKGRPVAERRIPQKKVQNAFQAYWEHQGMHAPHFILPPALNLAGQYSMLETDPGSLAYSFEYGSAAFFVMDTRSMRVRGPRGRTILGSGQWQALEAWLLSVKDHYSVKFLVSSSSMFFRMGVDIPMDRWSGFPEERDRLLGFIANNNIRGIYVLSGDLHAANSLEIDLTGRDGRPIKIWEFCSTPFEQAPNKMAKWSRLPIRSKWVDHQRCHFVVTQNNFGIVQVDFSNPNQPHVGFKVMGEKGAVLAEVGG